MVNATSNVKLRMNRTILELYTLMEKKEKKQSEVNILSEQCRDCFLFQQPILS